MKSRPALTILPLTLFLVIEAAAWAQPCAIQHCLSWWNELWACHAWGRADHHKFRPLLISARVISPVAPFARGAAAVPLLAAPALGMVPVPGNAAWRIKDQGGKKKKKVRNGASYPLAFPANGLQISLNSRATRRKDQNQRLSGIQRGWGVGMRWL